MKHDLDVFGPPAKEPKTERIDRLMPGYGRIAPLIEMANLPPGNLRLVVNWLTWAERIRRASVTPDNPGGRTYIYIQIESALMATMAMHGARNRQVVEGLIGATREEIARTFASLATERSVNGGGGPESALRSEATRALKTLDTEVGRIG